jgi:hypothetical protein
MAVANHGSPVPARPSPARRAFCVAADERSGAAHRAGWRVLDRFFAGIDGPDRVCAVRDRIEVVE